MRNSLKMETMSRYPLHLTYMEIILHYLLFRISHISQKRHTYTYNFINMLKQAAASSCGFVAIFFHHLFSTFPLLIFFYYGCCKCLSTCIPLYVHPHKIKKGTKGRKKYFLEFRGILDREVMVVCSRTKSPIVKMLFLKSH